MILNISEKFAIDGFDMSTLNVKIGTSQGGLWSGDFILESEDIMAEALRRDGAYFFYKQYKPRVITIPCYFYNVDEVMKRQILSKMNFKTPKKFIFDGVPYMYIYGYPINNISAQFMQYADNLYNGFLEYQIMCPDPFFYSTFLSSDGANYFEDSSPYGEMWYDAGIPYFEDLSNTVYTNITSSTDIVINNIGNFPAQISLNMTGSGTNIVVKNNTTNIQSNISSLSSENIKINGTTGQITDIAETVLKTSKFSGNFIELYPGDNELNINGTNINLSNVTFDFRYKFL